MGWNQPPDEENFICTQRRRFATDQKATILKRYLVNKVPISDLCDGFGIKPNQIYAWQNILVDNLEAIFHPATTGRETEIFAARDRKLAEARERRKEHAKRPACGRLPDRTKALR